MQHSGDWTKACILKPAIFARLYPEYADAAREFVRQRPDLCRMRFSCAHVAGIHGYFDAIACVTVHLESDTRMVDIRTVRGGDRFDVSIVSDYPKPQWWR